MEEKDNMDKKEVAVKDKNEVDIQDIQINPAALIKMALEKDVPVEMLDKLLDMRDRIKKEQAEESFRKAMADFQGECPVIEKTKPVFEKSSTTKVRFYYATLDTIVKAVQPFLKKNALSYGIETRQGEKGITVIVTASHTGGHSKVTDFTVPVDSKAFMNEPQKWASAQTFAKRYAFCNAFGILTGDQDDDGAKSGESEEETKEKEKIKLNEALTRIKGLSQNCIDGFKLLGYAALTVDVFCQKFDYDDKKIMVEINKIIDAKGVK